MATKEKNIWILLIFILSGLVVGGLLGELASKVDWLWWLSYNQVFGLENPIVLDLSVVKITFALMFKISISSIIGMVYIKKYKRQNRGNLDKKGMEIFCP